MPGSVPTAWGHRHAAIQMLRRVTSALVDLGGEIEWWERGALAQVSERSNWQHGEIYLTPSRISALRYARTGGEYGGELVTMCAGALERLSNLDAETCRRLKRSAGDLAAFLNGGGLPMLIVFNDVNVDDLAIELGRFKKVEEILSRLPQPDDPLFDVLTQQSNFRFRTNRGIVGRVELIVENGKP